MTTGQLAFAVVVYIVGLLALRRARYGLIGYVWAAFGLAALLVLAAQIGRWHEPVGLLEAQILAWIGTRLGVGLATLAPAYLVVPDPTGWSVMSIGVECSTLIEASVFTGLLLFYPRFPPGERMARLSIGLASTFVINLIRLGVIVALVTTLGKPVVPWAHAVAGRLIFFVGIVFVYWKTLTTPTLRMVRRDLETSGRSVT